MQAKAALAEDAASATMAAFFFQILSSSSWSWIMGKSSSSGWQ